MAYVTMQCHALSCNQLIFYVGGKRVLHVNGMKRVSDYIQGLSAIT